VEYQESHQKSRKESIFELNQQHHRNKEFDTESNKSNSLTNKKKPNHQSLPRMNIDTDLENMNSSRPFMMNKPSPAGLNSFDFTKVIEMSKERSKEKFPTPPNAIPSRPRARESYFYIAPTSIEDDSGTGKNYR
jgi:hypothetical protein